ncbi:hypothetical protein [Rhodoferax sp. U11-2br]|uniref:hypothetical protein n=1 Tax=Rhodoferax sp. U11-2br TaxID=2838878 RepID=UPI001BE5B2CC|nr:hypothetical protein [Rhodoferax sp. U11-2br]MBT3067331.1 hypothetical protein [Rhodoferax sp. U11-2br]
MACLTLVVVSMWEQALEATGCINHWASRRFYLGLGGGLFGGFAANFEQGPHAVTFGRAKAVCNRADFFKSVSLVEKLVASVVKVVRFFLVPGMYQIQVDKRRWQANGIC